MDNNHRSRADLRHLQRPTAGTLPDLMDDAETKPWLVPGLPMGRSANRHVEHLSLGTSGADRLPARVVGITPIESTHLCGKVLPFRTPRGSYSQSHREQWDNHQCKDSDG